jgi:hypothetical protein
MTTFDRIESRLPDLIDDLGAASVPDYFDDMLQRATRSRQRPAWSALERWLPMGVTARTVPVSPVPWRLLAIVAMIALIATATLIYAGSRSRPVPPFGIARNGPLVIGTADGEIATVDPVTGSPTVLITGPEIDGGPYLSPDGRRMVFDRAPSVGAPATTFVADADGSHVRPLVPAGTRIDRFDWSPTADRAVVSELIAGRSTVSILDVGSGVRTPILPDLDVVGVAWRPNHDAVVVTAKAGDNRTFWVVNADGSGLRAIPVSGYAGSDPTLSSDGHTLAYGTWEPGFGGRIRAVDIDSGGDHPVTTVLSTEFLWLDPQFSPDGSHLLVRRFIARQDPVVSQVSIMDVRDGSETVMGPLTENPPADFGFSPDGTQIIAEYPALKATWIFNADGSNGREAPFSAIGGGGASWQRMAP